MNKLYVELQEILEVEEIDPSQVLADFEAWDSLAALSLVASVRSNFGVTLTGEDLRRAATVGDLEKLVLSRYSPENAI
jgi:acyl carrier protein